MQNYKIDREMMRWANLSFILRLFKIYGALSKTVFSKLTELTIPAVTDLLSKLEAYQLITLLGETPIKRGRFPTLYKLNMGAFI